MKFPLKKIAFFWIFYMTIFLNSPPRFHRAADQVWVLVMRNQNSRVASNNQIKYTFCYAFYPHSSTHHIPRVGSTLSIFCWPDWAEWFKHQRLLLVHTMYRYFKWSFEKKIDSTFLPFRKILAIKERRSTQGWSRLWKTGFQTMQCNANQISWE